MSLQPPSAPADALPPRSLWYAAMDRLRDGVMLTDAAGTILWANRAFCRLSGYGRDELLGQDASILQTGLYDKAFLDRLNKDLRERGSWEGVVNARYKEGIVAQHFLSIQALHSEDELQGFISVVTYQPVNTPKNNAAWYDPLTGLPNRTHLMNVLLAKSSHSERKADRFALAFLEVQGMTDINGTYGRRAGDVLLRQIGSRLTETMRQGDLVARCSGDGFALILANTPTRGDARGGLRRILHSVKRPFSIDGHAFTVAMSAGVAIFPLDAEDPGVLLDLAIQAAEVSRLRKESSDVGITFYRPSITTANEEERRLRNELNRALADDGLTLYYQPQVMLAGDQIRAVEALLRWDHPRLGVVGAHRILALAAAIGHMDELNQWVLRTAWREITEFDAGRKVKLISINADVNQLRQPAFIEGLLAPVGGVGVDTPTIELEITEETPTAQLLAAEALLQRLHQGGVALALDDFGTGNTALKVLPELPFDALKLDKSLVKDLPGSQHAKMIQAVTAAAQALGLVVVAEGIESEAQLNTLRRLGCNAGQGYFIARPMPAQQLADWLAQPWHQ